MQKMNNKNKIFIDKLRSSGLRPTNQRVEISKFLFNRKKNIPFHSRRIKKLYEFKKIKKNFNSNFL